MARSIFSEFFIRYFFVLVSMILRGSLLARVGKYLNISVTLNYSMASSREVSLNNKKTIPIRIRVSTYERIKRVMKKMPFLKDRDAVISYALDKLEAEVVS